MNGAVEERAQPAASAASQGVRGAELLRTRAVGIMCSFTGLGHRFSVEVFTAALETRIVWLRIVGAYARRESLIPSDATFGSVLHLEYCRTFKMVDLSYESFLCQWKTAQEKTFALRVRRVEKLSDERSPALLQKEALECGRKEGAAAMAKTIVSVRDENSLLLRTAAKSEACVRLCNSLFMRETANGRRTSLSVHGVRVPKMFPTKAVFDSAVVDLVASELPPYAEVGDGKPFFSFAPLEDVLGKILAAEEVTELDVDPFRVFLIDHVDAIAVTNGKKRTPCSLRLFCPDLFPSDGGASRSMVWFDFEGPVQRLPEFNDWRVSEYNRVIGQTIYLQGVRIIVEEVWLVGDNERPQIEMGGCVSASVCRCPLCTLPAALFSVSPRCGLSRSLERAAVLFGQNRAAVARAAHLERFVNVRAFEEKNIDAHLKAVTGSMSYAPLLSIGSAFNLSCVHTSPAILHNVAQVLHETKKFLKTKMPAGSDLRIVEYIPCSQRRAEFSRWPEVFSGLEKGWEFVPDLAAQLTATLWQLSPATFVDAVRGQTCVLAIFFVLSSQEVEVGSNYFHGMAGHLFDFLLAMAERSARAVDFFEEAGERGAAPIRNFVQRHSNFKDNLFQGARIYEAIMERMRIARPFRSRCLKTNFSDIVISSCLFNKVDTTMETFRLFVADAFISPRCRDFISVSGQFVLFSVGIDVDNDECETVLACSCFKCVLPSRSEFVSLSAAPRNHWIFDDETAYVLSPEKVKMDPHIYDSLASLSSSPFGLEPPFIMSPAVERLLTAMPVSQMQSKLTSKKAAELKIMCKERKILDTGSKKDLVDRLVEFEVEKMRNVVVIPVDVTGENAREEAVVNEQPAVPGPLARSKPVPKRRRKVSSESVVRSYSGMSLKDLKQQCLDRKIPLGPSKKKEDLIGALQRADNRDRYVEERRALFAEQAPAPSKDVANVNDIVIDHDNIVDVAQRNDDDLLILADIVNFNVPEPEPREDVHVNSKRQRKPKRDHDFVDLDGDDSEVGISSIQKRIHVTRSSKKI